MTRTALFTTAQEATLRYERLGRGHTAPDAVDGGPR